MILEKRALGYRIRRKGQIAAYKMMGPVRMSKIYYYIIMKRKLDFDNPRLFSEKINWYKLKYCPNHPLIVQCSDKYAMRKYVEEKGYGDYLTPLIGVFENAEEIDFDALPERFALKCNHGCGYNIICGDKNKLDIGQTKKVLNAWMKENFGEYNAEPHYDKIKKRIICEKYLDTKQGFLPIDYKLHCLNGAPKFLLECSERNKDRLKCLFYDLSGKPLDYGTETSNQPMDISGENLREIIQISKSLAEAFPFVRVDFYLVEDKPIIGELSFTPAAGLIDYLSAKGDAEIGKMWDLSECQEECNK